MFFSFRSFTPRKHWQLRGSRRARAVTRIARAVYETVSGGRCPCVRKNRSRARVRTCFTALLDSSRTERTRTCDVISLVCVNHRVATMHFLAAVIFRHCSRTRRRSVYQWRYALILVARWARVRVKNEKDKFCCHRMFTSTLPMFSGVDLKGTFDLSLNF